MEDHNIDGTPRFQLNLKTKPVRSNKKQERRASAELDGIEQLH